MKKVMIGILLSFFTAISYAQQVLCPPTIYCPPEGPRAYCKLNILTPDWEVTERYNFKTPGLHKFTAARKSSATAQCEYDEGMSIAGLQRVKIVSEGSKWTETQGSGARCESDNVHDCPMEK